MIRTAVVVSLLVSLGCKSKSDAPSNPEPAPPTAQKAAEPKPDASRT